MTTPNFPQLAATFTALSTQIQQLTQQLQDEGTGGGANVVAVETPGPYVVPIPSGATHVDRVVISGGAGGGGRGSGAAGGSGGQGTTASITGAPTLTSPGPGGAGGGTTSPATLGKAPGNFLYNDQTYTGGNPGAVNTDGPGNNGGVPGAGGGGGAMGGLGGVGGSAGTWHADTVAITSGMTQITGTVGGGGTGGEGTATTGPKPDGGKGGSGGAYFYFY